MKVTFKAATENDIPQILVLMNQYYAYEGIPFVQQNARRRLIQLFKDPSLGQAWLIKQMGNTIGYVVITNGFGLEHGLNICVDELYLDPSSRGHGVGEKTIEFLKCYARKHKIVSINTQVEKRNRRACFFWESRGFERQDRYPMVHMME